MEPKSEWDDRLNSNVGDQNQVRRLKMIEKPQAFIGAFVMIGLLLQGIIDSCPLHKRIRFVGNRGFRVAGVHCRQGISLEDSGFGSGIVAGVPGQAVSGGTEASGLRLQGTHLSEPQRTADALVQVEQGVE